MITVKDLKYTYPGAHEETLHGLNFEIAEGEIFGFLGMLIAELYLVDPGGNIGSVFKR